MNDPLRGRRRGGGGASSSNGGPDVVDAASNPRRPEESSWYFLGDGLFDRCAFELAVSRAQLCAHDAQ
jgi:hypothetical protein